MVNGCDFESLHLLILLYWERRFVCIDPNASCLHFGQIAHRNKLAVLKPMLPRLIRITVATHGVIDFFILFLFGYAYHIYGLLFFFEFCMEGWDLDWAHSPFRSVSLMLQTGFR